MKKNQQLRKIADIAACQSGGTPGRGDLSCYNGSIPWVKSGELSAGIVRNTEETLTEKGLENSSAKWIPEDSVLVAMYGANAGQIARLAIKATTNQAVLAIIPDRSVVQPLYLYYAVSFISGELLKKVQGSGQANLSSSLIKSQTVYVPDLKNQENIAGLLYVWDTAIEKLEVLINEKKKLKQALEQQLLTGQIRIKGFSTPWKALKLKDVTTELKKRNHDNALTIDKVMGVNKRHGLIPMRAETIGAFLNRYKIIPPQAFAYNPMRLNIGSLAISDKDEDVLVSPDYVVFSCKEGKLDPDYFNHYRRSHIWVRYMEMAGNGSVRIRIYYKDLSVMKIRLPDIKEQKAIAAVLNKCTEELDALQAQLAAFKKQKRGLMQKLLTGQWRVKGAA